MVQKEEVKQRVSVGSTEKVMVIEAVPMCNIVKSGDMTMMKTLSDDDRDNESDAAGGGDERSDYDDE